MTQMTQIGNASADNADNADKALGTAKMTTAVSPPRVADPRDA
jgi:hypothetical protein